jgi:uncharacterized protein YfdQ (DUF2303 family)
VSLDTDAINRLVALGGAANQFTPEGGDFPVILVPSGTNLLSLEKFLPPSRIQQQVTLLEVESFVAYVNRFKGEDTLIFVNVTEQGAVFKAVIDYHGQEGPDYCSHVVNFSLIQTPEWKTWMEADRDLMSQVDFATWLEDNEKLLREPSGAALLELVRDLHGHKNARFNSAVRLDTGAHTVGYEEDVVIRGSNSSKSDEMALPPVIVAGISVFQGAPAYKVAARLKCRVEDRQLHLFFETINSHTIVRESIMLAVKEVAEKTKIIPLLGSPQ